jgi:DNA primase
MRIGYAPGGCLRGWLTRLGYPVPALRQAGLVSVAGYDTYRHRIVFPLEGNLYGRSLSTTAPPHRFWPGVKGGLYLWAQVRQCPEVILVEGLFDYAVLWQAGFHNVTCSMGNHLNAHQYRQLCDHPRTVYLAFDTDTNGTGQQAAQSLACRLREQGMNVRRVRAKQPRLSIIGSCDRLPANCRTAEEFVNLAHGRRFGGFRCHTTWCHTTSGYAWHLR